MSSFSSPSPLTIPFKFRRKSSSASASTSMDSYVLSFVDAAQCSSPLPSSLPSLAPLHFTRRNEYVERQAGDYSDDLDAAAYNQQGKLEDATHPWSCRTHQHPYTYRPLPSLMTKFAHALRNDAPLSYSPSPSSYTPQPTCYYPERNSAIADDCEEYDLESMNIQIRETYFATSAERGRWLSSPIASRVRSQAVPPMRAHSSPVKTLADASPLKERVRGHKISCSFGGQTSTPLSESRDEDVRCSSSLPPSSPITSPMSNLSFLSDYEGDSVVGHSSNLDDCHSLGRTPELSICSTTCTSPVEPTRTPTPHEAPAVVSPPHPMDFCHPAPSIISRHTNPCSPKHIDIHVHALNSTNFEPDSILSPLSQFELDLPEVEPPKLPLSDTVNKPYPGQPPVSPGMTLEVAQSQGGPPSTPSLSVNSNREPLDISLDTVNGSGSNKKAKKRRGSATGNPGAKRTRKRANIRSGNSSSDAKERRGTQSCSSNYSERPSKKTKLSHRGDDFESRGAKSLPRHSEISKIKRLSPSPSRPAVEGYDSERPRDRKIPKPTQRAQLQQPTSSPSTKPVSTDSLDVEFHASLTGMLIEALATSRATSMDASALHLVLTQAHPYLAAERPREELLMNIAAVLEAGRSRCGVFEKVDGSGERSRHRVLESRWFYVPERDEDQERASLISAIMPRQKRNETKKYKQYYYRPLDKISRWDPEDAP